MIIGYSLAPRKMAAQLSLPEKLRRTNMSTAEKINQLYEHSTRTVAEADLEALANSLAIGNEYGLDAYFDESGSIYQITRHSQDVYECSDIVELMNVTWAIINFMEIGEQHQSAA